MTIEVAAKACKKCGEVKPLSDFYRDRNRPDGRYYYCKVCHRAETDAAAKRRREEMGEEEWLRQQRIKIAAHRGKTGNATGKAYARAQRQAARVLRERHRREYDLLLLLARRGELETESEAS